MAKIVYGVSGEGSGHSSRSRRMINHFLYRLPDFKESLTGYRAEDNSQIKAKLEELLKNDCALAQEYHRKRSRSTP